MLDKMSVALKTFEAKHGKRAAVDAEQVFGRPLRLFQSMLSALAKASSELTQTLSSAPDRPDPAYSARLYSAEEKVDELVIAIQRLLADEKPMSLEEFREAAKAARPKA